MQKTILVVEDNPINRTLLRDLLTHYGYAVVEAENGRDGVEIASRILPDLVIMDIQMPVMNGFAATSLLKEDPKTKDIKVVAVTSFAMAGDREKVMNAGADEYISKPIDTRELPRLIERLIGK